MNPVLLDTGVLVAALDRSEAQHQRCCDALQACREPLISCEAVIAEACYLLRSVHGAAEAILKNVSDGQILLPLRLSDMAIDVSQLLTQYQSVPMDLADACLVALASRLRTGKILTLDGDFAIYRYGKNKAFELLPGLIGGKTI